MTRASDSSCGVAPRRPGVFAPGGALRSRAGRVAREGLAHLRGISQRGHPRVAFLPSSSREGASLLRIYRIAEALGQDGHGVLVLPRHLRQGQRRRVLAGFRSDLLVVQGARHDLNRLALLPPGVPFLLDLDDADFLDPKQAQPLADLASGSAAVIAGSRFNADWARQHANRVEVIWTGSTPTTGPRPDHTERAPIVTWAQASPMRYRSELRFVADVMARVVRDRGEARLRLYGITDGTSPAELGPMVQPGLRLELLPPMPYDDFIHSLREVSVGLSAIIPESTFSQGKSFGKILGYLDAKVPVICSDEADHSGFFDAQTGVVSNDPDRWATEISALLDDPARRNRMADAAFEQFQQRLSLDAASRQTAALIREVLECSAVTTAIPRPSGPVGPGATAIHCKDS